MTLLVQNCRCEPNKLQGVSDGLYHALGSARRAVGAGWAAFAAGETGGEPRSAGLGEPTGVQRDIVRSAHRLPMEEFEKGMVRLQQQPARPFPNLEPGRRAEEDLSEVAAVLRCEAMH